MLMNAGGGGPTGPACLHAARGVPQMRFLGDSSEENAKNLEGTRTEASDANEAASDSPEAKPNILDRHWDGHFGLRC